MLIAILFYGIGTVAIAVMVSLSAVLAYESKLERIRKVEQNRSVKKQAGVVCAKKTK